MQLVLLNVSDHHTRAKANAEDAGTAPRVLGALLGHQNGRVVDISNSFEFAYENTPQGVMLDMNLLTKKTEQCKPAFSPILINALPHSMMITTVDKQVFPTLDIVGWYATGESVNEADMHILRKVSGCPAALSTQHNLFCPMRFAVYKLAHPEL